MKPWILSAERKMSYGAPSVQSLSPRCIVMFVIAVCVKAVLVNIFQICRNLIKWCPSNSGVLPLIILLVRSTLPGSVNFFANNVKFLFVCNVHLLKITGAMNLLTL